MRECVGLVIRTLTYKEIDRGEWSRLVQTSATGTWFQTPEAYEFFASQSELFKPFVVAISNDASLNEAQHSINSSLQTLRAVCVGYVTLERNPLKQYFTRRAIINGGPALADDATDEEVVALLEAVKEKASLQLSPVGKRDTAQEPSHLGCFKGRLCSLLLGRDGVGSPIYIETRNFNDYSRWKGAFEKAGFSYQPHLNFHVDCTDIEQMWERLSENRKRQVRHVNGDSKFEISNLRLDNIPVTEQDVREWYAILSELYRTKVKTPLWPVEFFVEAYRQGVGQFLLVRHEGKIIGGSMVVRDEKTVYEWFECGLNAQSKEQYPSVMATYAGMCYAAEEGIGRYDMMGAGVPDVPYGVRDFKAEFGGKMVEHGRFLCVCEPILYKIGALAVRMIKKLN